jgi:hypothetical protein
MIATLETHDALRRNGMKCSVPCCDRPGIDPQGATTPTPQIFKIVRRIIVDWPVNPPFHPAIQSVAKVKCRAPHAAPKAGRAGVANAFAESQSSVSGPGPQSFVKVSIVYESDLNFDRAQRMQEELAQRLGQSFVFLVSRWSLKSLERSEIRKVAARSIAEADIICFSLLAGGEIPQHVTKWLEKGLLRRKTPKRCLLALVETGGMLEPRLSRAEVYLSQLSVAAGVDCLCHSDSIPIARSMRNSSRRTSSKMDETGQESVPWGRAEQSRVSRHPSLACVSASISRNPKARKPATVATENTRVE